MLHSLREGHEATAYIGEYTDVVGFCVQRRQHPHHRSNPSIGSELGRCRPQPAGGMQQNLSIHLSQKSVLLRAVPLWHACGVFPLTLLQTLTAARRIVEARTAVEDQFGEGEHGSKKTSSFCRFTSR